MLQISSGHTKKNGSCGLCMIMSFCDPIFLRYCYHNVCYILLNMVHYIVIVLF